MSEKKAKIIQSFADQEFINIGKQDILGVGSYATVRLVKHKKTGVSYALKSIEIGKNQRLDPTKQVYPLSIIINTKSYRWK